ncbi:MAG: glutathione S-transferase family protein [Bordetella sp.]|uniref:glutathione S-transferase family protein n=1 Tax=Bordetella sp. TaxID=28081 RepID=UPI003F7C9750
MLAASPTNRLSPSRDPYVLYYSPGACSLAVHIVLEELDAPYRLECVSVADGETAREPYLNINPKGRVPALAIKEEGRVLTELPAILDYLAHSDPAGRLLPGGGALPQARREEWLAWLSGWVHAVGFGLLWRPGRFDTDPAHYDALHAMGRRTIEKAFQDIERQLADGRQWAVAEGYSVVDPFLLVLFRWGNRIGLAMHQAFPAWAALCAKLLQRPAVVRALEQEEGTSIDG